MDTKPGFLTDDELKRLLESCAPTTALAIVTDREAHRDLLRTIAAWLCNHDCFELCCPECDLLRAIRAAGIEANDGRRSA